MASGERGAGRSAEPRTVLLASSRQEDVKALAVLLQGEPWILTRADTWYEALKVMGTVIVPVLLCDRDLPGLDWPNGFGKFRAVLRLPALLLLSDVTSSTLSDDILRFGAFDVLSRPFSKESLISTLEFARTHWEMWPRSLFGPCDQRNLRADRDLPFHHRSRTS
jgi:CheY-like chemotaxis protein